MWRAHVSVWRAHVTVSRAPGGCFEVGNHSTQHPSRCAPMVASAQVHAARVEVAVVVPLDDEGVVGEVGGVEEWIR